MNDAFMKIFKFRQIKLCTENAAFFIHMHLHCAIDGLVYCTCAYTQALADAELAKREPRMLYE